ncbi:MAG: TM1812 family CRISPR-associated protein [Oscillospiraceae bacterium]|nr:TM1812 family CRISPR-associated protein [Oscillospiraceae bacterium]
MNVIITNLSRLHSNATPCHYGSDLGEIIGTHTNDAPVTYLLRFLEKQSPGVPVRIIAVTTPEAKDAFVALSEAVRREHSSDVPELRQVDVAQMAATIHHIVELIPSDAHVYIDTTGGFRNSSYLLMAVVRILEYSGIRLEKAVYSRFEEHCKQIEDVTATYRLFDLISAANSFTEFGNSRELSAFFQEHGHPEVQHVLLAMNDFSEAVALCRTSRLDEVLFALNDSLQGLDAMQTDDQNEILLRSISGMIRQKFGIEKGSTKAEYPSVIEWCLEHQLIQQAVTIYTEKIGSFFFQNGYLTADEEVVQSILSRPNHFDPYYRLFFEKFMNMRIHAEPDQQPLTKFLLQIKDHKELLEQLAASPDAEAFLWIAPQYRSVLGDLGTFGLDRTLLLVHAVFGSDSVRRTPEDIQKAIAAHPDLQDIPDKCTARKPVGFLKNIITNQKLHTVLQGGVAITAHRYQSSFINTIEYLESALKGQKHFTLHTDHSKMQTIMRDYLFIKNFLRNSFNHASDTNGRSKEEIAYFNALGYPTQETPALQDIVSVMRSAVQHCKEAKP